MQERIRPILFNGTIVRAIRAGDKTETRRAVKLKYSNTHHEMRTDKYGTRLIEIQDDIEGETYGRNADGSTWHKLRGYIEPKPQYQEGDILYIRETWAFIPCIECPHEGSCRRSPVTYTDRHMTAEGCFLYRADHPLPERIVWNTSIHMPREVAREWVRVTDVRAERLQSMTDNDCIHEGIRKWTKDGKLFKYCHADAEGDAPACEWKECPRTPRGGMKQVWDTTVKKSEMDLYGWDADPWVWVYKFEKCEKPAE